MTNPKPRAMAATEAHARFGGLMRGAGAGDVPVVIYRAGQAEAVALQIEDYERLRARQPDRDDWWAGVERARAEVARSLDGHPLPNIEELIREMREERDAQILGNLLGRESGGEAGGESDRRPGARALEGVEG